MTSLKTAIEAFLAAPTWAPARAVVEAHPILLNPEAVDGLHRYKDASRDTKGALIQEHIDLLIRARQIGVEAAFADKVATGSPDAGFKSERFVPAGGGPTSVTGATMEGPDEARPEPPC
jgi:hypothetical protein